MTLTPKLVYALNAWLDTYSKEVFVEGRIVSIHPILAPDSVILALLVSSLDKDYAYQKQSSQEHLQIAEYMMKASYVKAATESVLALLILFSIT